MGSDDRDTVVTREQDGSRWQIGTATDVDWIAKGTSSGLSITSGIPPVFAAYATVVLPTTEDEQEQRDRTLLALLNEHSANQPWWLGYLDTGGADIVFPDAPMVTLYADWRYVLVALSSAAPPDGRADHSSRMATAAIGSVSTTNAAVSTTSAVVRISMATAICMD